MTLNDNDSNHSGSDRSRQSPLRDSIPANQDTAFSRREFLGMTAASLIMAGTLSLTSTSATVATYVTKPALGSEPKPMAFCAHVFGPVGFVDDHFDDLPQATGFPRDTFCNPHRNS